MNAPSDYTQFRGKCKEMSEALVAADPSLKLVRGHYICPMWGEQAHWWTVRVDGSVNDPTAAQFPSGGLGEYVPFDGFVECANCNATIEEGKVRHSEGRYAFCSYRCHGLFVGAIV